MEKETIIIFIVALIVIAAILSFIYFNSINPQAENRGTQTGELEAPVPFKPFGEAQDSQIIVGEQECVVPEPDGNF